MQEARAWQMHNISNIKRMHPTNFQGQTNTLKNSNAVIAHCHFPFTVQFLFYLNA